MPPSKVPTLGERLPVPGSGDEDYLDWEENQKRDPDDCRAVDRRFLGGWAALTAFWVAAITVSGGSLGGLAVAGYCLFTHHFPGH